MQEFYNLRLVQAAWAAWAACTAGYSYIVVPWICYCYKISKQWDQSLQDVNRDPLDDGTLQCTALWDANGTHFRSRLVQGSGVT